MAADEDDDEGMYQVSTARGAESDPPPADLRSAPTTPSDSYDQPSNVIDIGNGNAARRSQQRVEGLVFLALLVAALLLAWRN